MKSQLKEEVKPVDLEDQVSGLIAIDTFKPKLCDERDVMVAAFSVSRRECAGELCELIAKSPCALISAEVLSEQDGEGNHVVLVEMDRDREMFNQLDNLLNHIGRAAPVIDWSFKTRDIEAPAVWSWENFYRSVPQSPEEYAQHHGGQEPDAAPTANPTGPDSAIDYASPAQAIDRQLSNFSQSNAQELQKQVNRFIGEIQRHFEGLSGDHRRLLKAVEELQAGQLDLRRQLEVHQEREKIAMSREQRDVERIKDLEDRLSRLLFAPVQNSGLAVADKENQRMATQQAELVETFGDHQDVGIHGADSVNALSDFTATGLPDALPIDGIPSREVSAEEEPTGGLGPIQEQSPFMESIKPSDVDSGPDWSSSADVVENDAQLPDAEAGTFRLRQEPLTDRPAAVEAETPEEQHGAGPDQMAETTAVSAAEEDSGAAEGFLEEPRREYHDFPVADEPAAEKPMPDADVEPTAAVLETNDEASILPATESVEELGIEPAEEIDPGKIAAAVSGTFTGEELLAKEDADAGLAEEQDQGVEFFVQRKDGDSSVVSEPATDQETADDAGSGQRQTHVAADNEISDIIELQEEVFVGHSPIEEPVPGPGGSVFDGDVEGASDHETEPARAEENDAEDDGGVLQESTSLIVTVEDDTEESQVDDDSASDIIDLNEELDTGAFDIIELPEKDIIPKPTDDAVTATESANEEAPTAGSDVLTTDAVPEDNRSDVFIDGSTETVLEADSAKRAFERGKAACNLKAYAEAAEHFTRFVELAPDQPRGHYNLAILHYRLKQYRRARRHARQAIDLAYEPAVRILKKIESKLAISNAVEKSTGTQPNGQPAQQAVDRHASQSDAAADPQRDVGEIKPIDREDPAADMISVEPGLELPGMEKTSDSSTAEAATVTDGASTSWPRPEGTGANAPEPAEGDQRRPVSDGAGAAEDKPGNSVLETMTPEVEIGDLFRRGKEAFDRKNYSEAVEHFSRYAELAPEEPRGHYNLAILFYRLKDYPRAKNHAERSVQSDYAPAGRILDKITAKIAQKDLEKMAAAQEQSSGTENAAGTGDLPAAFLEDKQPVPPPSESTPEDVRIGHSNPDDHKRAERAGKGAAGFESRDQSAAEKLQEYLFPEPEKPAEPDGHLESMLFGSLAVDSDPPLLNANATPDENLFETPDKPEATDAEASAENDERSLESDSPEIRTAAAKTDLKSTPPGKRPEISPAKRHFALGIDAFRQKNYPEAIEQFERYIALLPREAKGHYNLAVSLYRQKLYDTALDHAQQALALGAESSRKIIKKIGSKMMQEGASFGRPSGTDNLGRAFNDMMNFPATEIDNSDSEDDTTSIWDADELEEEISQSQFSEAVKDDDHGARDDVIIFESAMVPKADASTGSTPGLDGLPDASAGTLINKEPEPSEAVGVASAADDTRSPDNGNGNKSAHAERIKNLFKLGKAAAENKEYLKAIQHFTKVTHLAPGDPRGYYHLAVVSYRLKFYETAREHASRAVELGSEPAQKVLQKIAARSTPS